MASTGPADLHQPVELCGRDIRTTPVVTHFSGDGKFVAVAISHSQALMNISFYMATYRWNWMTGIAQSAWLVQSVHRTRIFGYGMLTRPGWHHETGSCLQQRAGIAQRQQQILLFDSSPQLPPGPPLKSPWTPPGPPWTFSGLLLALLDPLWTCLDPPGPPLDPSGPPLRSLTEFNAV